MSHEDIAHLLKLLETRRSRLRIALQQIKQVGPGTSAISLQLEIDTIRAEIRTYKQQLHNFGQVVEDSIVDTATDEAQLRILNLPTDHVPEPKPLPAHSRMHLFTNPLFVGREQELMQIANDIQTHGTSIIVAITGMGGMGKSQLASEFVHRYGHHFAGGVYWLSFAEPAGIEAEIVACGTAMDLANSAGLKFPEQVQLVKQAWQQQIPRLLVFDNCEDEALLQKYLPKGSACQVLITSRRQYRDTKLPLAKVRLARLPRHESIALLRQFRSDLTEQNPDLYQIAEKLGDWPLALHVAGSYLKLYRRKISPAQYLEKLQQAPLQGFAVRALEDTPTEHERDLAQTLMVSYQHLEPTDPTDGLALKILNYAAHLAPDEPINLDFLEKLVEEHVTELDDELVFEDAIARLEELGLIEREEQDAIRLHSLISAFVLEHNQDATVQSAIEQYFLRVSDEIDIDHEQFLALRYSLSHLRYTTNQAYERADKQAARLQTILAHCLRFSYDYDGALNHYHQAQELFQALDKRLGLANTLASRGEVALANGDQKLADDLLQQAIDIYQQIGKRYSIAAKIGNYGWTLRRHKRYQEAKPYLLRAADLFEQINLGAQAERHRRAAKDG